jgi:hypothetical protein
MDEKSTPIESLNNIRDDSEVVNKILNKYNNLQDGNSDMPPLNKNIPEMENQFENRNLNQEMFNHNSNNIAYKDHYKKEIQRTEHYINPNDQDDQDDQDDNYEDYEDYEVIEIPLWRRILNEIRIPLFIFIFIIIFSNCNFDKFLIKRIPIMGNPFNECNTYGFLLKAFLISLFSYIFIKFIRL